MLTINLAGNTGRDAEYRTTDNSEFCRFSVAAETGFGDRKVTTWVDVTKWGKGSEGLARILRKGSKVAVSGEMTLREHEGKTYVQCKADHVAILGTPDAGAKPANPDRYESHRAKEPEFDDSEVPF